MNITFLPGPGSEKLGFYATSDTAFLMRTDQDGWALRVPIVHDEPIRLVQSNCSDAAFCQPICLSQADRIELAEIERQLGVRVNTPEWVAVIPPQR